MEDWNIALLLLFWCFTTLRYFSGHFGHSQLTYPNCSWASHLGSLSVLSAHSFASNWQLPFFNEWKGENTCRNYFMTKLHERMLPDVRTEPVTVHIPGGRASDWATASSTALLKLIQSQEDIFCYLSYHIVPLLKKKCSSKIMRKPAFAIWEQQRCQSACASAQSDQHLCYSLLRQNNTSSFYIKISCL